MGTGPEDAQAEYYRARAREYDDFWYRRGPYALEPEIGAQWSADTTEAEAAARRWAPDGTVLELACGTGIWTRLLVERATRVVAVDSSAEMIELNRHRTAGHRVEYVKDDLFSWQPPKGGFDGVFMGYWHSHVPDRRLTSFWEGVRAALRPGGRVMLVDSAPFPPGTPADRTARTEARTLRDGRQFDVVKRCWDPVQLGDWLDSRGWRVDARTTTHGMILVAELACA